ncbi:MAG TPA: amidohydrolase family protein [Acidimicrobiales bacterium]|nr:amidohydrolase family protein [Acidimicrobiales bacterium]
MATIEASPRNAWRTDSPGCEGWARSARPDDPHKLFMVSADCHAVEPALFLAERIEPEYRERIPRLETREDGSQWTITEGNRPALVKPGKRSPKVQAQQSFEGPEHNRHWTSRMEPQDQLRNSTGKTMASRLDDQAADGVDVELVFPNKGLLNWATPDPVLADAMCRAWNRWAHDFHGGAEGWYGGRSLPMACIATGEVRLAMAEITWAAEQGFAGLCLGNSPIYGPKKWGNLEYNDPSFEPMWALVEETGLPITFHVSTGRDPRAVGGNGGAIINYVCHSMETTIEPLVQMITSGVFERHPGLRAGLVESGIGFFPWLAETMDYAYRVHHFWVRPVIPELPSVYLRRHCFASFQEDHHGLDTAEETALVGCYLWANDYPHHEGSWPASAPAIERQMVGLSDPSRAQILGLNAARIFNLPVTR